MATAVRPCPHCRQQGCNRSKAARTAELPCIHILDAPHTLTERRYAALTEPSTHTHSRSRRLSGEEDGSQYWKAFFPRDRHWHVKVAANPKSRGLIGRVTRIQMVHTYLHPASVRSLASEKAIHGYVLVESVLNARKGVSTMNSWVKPDFEEISVNAECTAYVNID